MRLLLDFAPLALFFVAYKSFGLMTATVVLILATAVSLGITYAKERRVAVTPLISGILVAVFGGLTLWLQDETFIKMKPTMVNLIFAVTLLVGYALDKPLLKYVLDSAVQLQPVGWRKLTLRWGLFFLFLACLNEAIWRHFSTEFWVNFKVFGMLSATILFSLAQLPLIKRYWVEEKE